MRMHNPCVFAAIACVVGGCCGGDSSVSVVDNRHVYIGESGGVYLEPRSEGTKIFWKGRHGDFAEFSVRRQLQYVHLQKNRGGFAVDTDGIIGHIAWPASGQPEASFRIPAKLASLDRLGKIVCSRSLGVVQVAVCDDGRLLISNTQTSSIRIESMPLRPAEIVGFDAVLVYDADKVGVTLYVAGWVRGATWLWSIEV